LKEKAMDRKWLVLIITSLGTLMAGLDVTIVNIAFPDIARSFPGTSLSDLSWVLNGYTIVFAAALIPAGRIADLAGRKRLFLWGLVTFTTASALSGLAPSLGVLIGARLVQGLGAAMMIPAALGLVLPEFPPSRRATAVALWGVSSSVAVAAGPPLGGVIVDLAGWRWIFFINVPVGVVAIVAAARILIERRAEGTTRMPDLLGAAALAIAIAALALGIVKSDEWGWTSGRVLGSFALAAVLLAFFLTRSARHPAPALDLSLWRVRSFTVANIAMVLFAMAFFAVLLASVLFLTEVWRYSSARAGLAITPGPVVAGIVGVIAGRIADRRGQRVVIVPGTLIFAAGTLWLTAALGTTRDFLGAWLPAFLLMGLGVGLSFAALTSAAVASLPADRSATGSAVSNTARQIGAVLGVAVLITILGTDGSTDLLDRLDGGFRFAALCSVASGVVALFLGRVRATGSEPAKVQPAPAVRPEGALGK
jgi:EmrB/QacA subfamily drug resistance transporter